MAPDTHATIPQNISTRPGKTMKVPRYLRFSQGSSWDSRQDADVMDAKDIMENA